MPKQPRGRKSMKDTTTVSTNSGSRVFLRRPSDGVSVTGCQVVHVNHGYSSTQSRRERKDEEFEPAKAPKKYAGTKGKFGRDATGHQQVLDGDQDTRDEVLCAADLADIGFPQGHLDFMFGILKRHQVIRQTKFMLESMSQKPIHVAARDMLNVFSLTVSEAQQNFPDKLERLSVMHDEWIDKVADMKRAFTRSQASQGNASATGPSGRMDVG